MMFQTDHFREITKMVFEGNVILYSAFNQQLDMHPLFFAIFIQNYVEKEIVM